MYIHSYNFTTLQESYFFHMGASRNLIKYSDTMEPHTHHQNIYLEYKKSNLHQVRRLNYFQWLRFETGNFQRLYIEFGRLIIISYKNKNRYADIFKF